MLGQPCGFQVHGGTADDQDEDEETANPLNAMVSRIEYERVLRRLSSMDQLEQEAAETPALQASNEVMRSFSCRPLYFACRHMNDPYCVDMLAIIRNP